MYGSKKPEVTFIENVFRLCHEVYQLQLMSDLQMFITLRQLFIHFSKCFLYATQLERMDSSTTGDSQKQNHLGSLKLICTY